MTESEISVHVSQPTPVFVLGCPRSGTTLVGGLLGETQWGAAVETQFILKYFTIASKMNLNDRSDFQRLVKSIVAERAVKQWGIQWDIEQLFESTEHRNYAGLVNRICQTRSDQMGVTSWADKTPHYCLSLSRIVSLREMFPLAKFVFVIRDGRDVANSLLQKPWGPNNVYQCAEYWRACCESLMEAMRLCPDDCRLIRYEQLLQHPESSLRELFKFLDVPDPDSMAAKSAPLMDGSKVGQWKRRMSARQVAVFEKTAGNLLAANGYETLHKQKPIGYGSQMAYRIHDRCKWLAFMFRQNVVDTIKIRFFGKQPFAE
ncbi:sulfotransferase family protein [Stieleria varia]|uniref:Sulfotransferase domain protein n=1 Tax=Stieleria varia TaxID=2528005 RepID=A0A5C6AMN4_9BACT|nr:sulfotransferase [Stieleria varia]TWU01275.1 Sulfotransferase domain protein [Stieleria varia]